MQYDGWSDETNLEDFIETGKIIIKRKYIFDGKYNKEVIVAYGITAFLGYKNTGTKSLKKLAPYSSSLINNGKPNLKEYFNFYYNKCIEIYKKEWNANPKSVLEDFNEKKFITEYLEQEKQNLKNSSKFYIEFIESKSSIVNKIQEASITYIKWINNKMTLASGNTVEENKNDNIDFLFKDSDFRETTHKKVDFSTIKNTRLFQIFEEKLFENGFIDIDYNFTKKHGLKKKLAAIYQILIDKNYFKETNYKYPNRKLVKTDYRQYLDIRYNVDTSQEFKRLAETDIKDLIYLYSWIENIPSC